MGKFGLILKGIIKENPTFVLVLGMCPTLGTTTSAINGMGMGLATTFIDFVKYGNFCHSPSYSC